MTQLSGISAFYAPAQEISEAEQGFPWTLILLGVGGCGGEAGSACC